MATLLADTARAAPTLLILDDLHWADTPTLRLLRYVARSRVRGRMLMLVTFRRAETATHVTLAETLEDLRRDGVLERVVLDGLPPEDVADLVRSVTGEAPPEGFAEVLWLHTDGNPFFAEEVLHHIPGPLPDGSREDLAQMLRGAGTPLAVVEIVGRRLRRLPENSRDALAVASVLGQRFDTDLLAAVAQIDEDAVHAALAEPLRARIVQDDDELPGRLAFHHALVRDVLYDGLPVSARARLHARTANLLEARPDLQPLLADIAHHLGRAGPEHGDRAAAYSRRAAERALDLLAYEEAAEHFSRALALLEQGERAGQDAVRERADLHLQIGEARSRATELEASRGAFRRAAALARELDDADLLARAALGFAGRRVARFGRREDEEMALLEEALDALGSGDPGLRTRLLARLAQAWYLVDHKQVGRLAAAATAAAPVDDAQAGHAALEARLFSSWQPGASDQRIALATELIEDAQRQAAHARLAEGLNWRLVAALELGDRAGAEDDARRYASLAEELRIPQMLADSSAHRALFRLMDGRLEEADANARAAAEAAPQGGADDAAQNLGLHLFTLRDEQQRLDELEAPLTSFIEQYGAIPGWRLARAWVWARTGREADARAALAELSDGDFSAIPRDANWPASLSLAARLAAELDEPEAGHAVARCLEPFLGLHVVASYAVYWGPVAHHVGLGRAAAGGLDDAVAHFAAALEQSRRVEAPRWAERAQAAWAGVLERRNAPGDHESAELVRAGVVLPET